MLTLFYLGAGIVVSVLVFQTALLFVGAAIGYYQAASSLFQRN